MGDIVRDIVMIGIGDIILDLEIWGELKSKVFWWFWVLFKFCYRIVMLFVFECFIEFWYFNEKILINGIICFIVLFYLILINYFIFYYEIVIC